MLQQFVFSSLSSTEYWALRRRLLINLSVK
jgi:hypothetical protein